MMPSSTTAPATSAFKPEPITLPTSVQPSGVFLHRWAQPELLALPVQPAQQAPLGQQARLELLVLPVRPAPPGPLGQQARLAPPARRLQRGQYVRLGRWPPPRCSEQVPGVTRQHTR